MLLWEFSDKTATLVRCNALADWILQHLGCLDLRQLSCIFIVTALNEVFDDASL